MQVEMRLAVEDRAAEIAEDRNAVDRNGDTPEREKMIAPWWHLIVFFLIMCGVLYSGWAAQHFAYRHVPPISSGPAVRQSPIGTWLGAAAADMALLFFCWAGVRQFGGNLLALSGGRWKSWREFATDIAITIPFWMLWEGVAYGVYALIGPSHASSVFPLIPRTAAEAITWVFLSVTAGFCEELIFRGYLQRQLLGVSGSVIAAVVGQGLIFGLAHSYQGWKPVFVIAILGILYGALAAWRRNLRVNMLAHAATDVFEGWVKFLMFPRWFPS